MVLYRHFYTNCRFCIVDCGCLVGFILRLANLLVTKLTLLILCSCIHPFANILKMRRRSKRVQVANDSKNESPKKPRSSARRRKRSSSKSSNENDTSQCEELVQNTEHLQANPDQVDSNINNSGHEENEDRHEESDNCDKGKSTGMNDTNNEQTSNNIEPENEYNENVQSKETQNDETHEILEEISEPNDIKIADENEKCNEKDQDNSTGQTNGDIKNKEERSTTPETKAPNHVKPERKRITLKRSPIDKSQRPFSPLEDGEIQEPKEKSRKITLKRRTTEESNPEFDKIIINRRSSAGDDNSDKRKRLSSATEENILTVVGKPNKPSQMVKLVRDFSQEHSEDSKAPHRVRKNAWGKSEFLDELSSNIFKIDINSIKVVCPTVEFLKESEVNLQEVYEEPAHLDSEMDKKMKEEEEKSEEESEKEPSEEEVSSDEQKIEANPNIIALNRKISIVEDTAANMKPPPSPAKNPLSAVLYITNLVRPFTVKQLRELLERTGKIKEDGFWTDRIKSKCYAIYENIEEAEATRNALHGVYWPIGNGKQLVIDYATEEEMEGARNPAVPLPAPLAQKLPDIENKEPDLADGRHRELEWKRDIDKTERRRDTSERDWDKSKEEHRRRHSRSRSREREKKNSRRSYTPADHNRKKKVAEDSVPQKLMDDLFLKTKAMPSIYWQPLSPQEIATKQQQRLVRMEEHKRRIESRSRREKDRRGSFRRR